MQRNKSVDRFGRAVRRPRVLFASALALVGALFAPMLNTNTSTAEDVALVRPPVQHPIQNDVFYFVLPDRFHNVDPRNDFGGDRGGKTNNDVLRHGFAPERGNYYHGGDIKGLLTKLDYLKKMGVTAVWMTPVFKNQAVQCGATRDINNCSGAYHGYWITDFTQVDPHLGTNADLKALINSAHDRGIKVFFDIITNHTADVIQYQGGKVDYVSKADRPYKDAAGNVFDDRQYAQSASFPSLDPNTSFPYIPSFRSDADKTIKKPAWLNNPIYYHNRGDSTFSGENSEYGDFVGLDDLFTEHPDVVKGMTDIYKTWITDFNVDGYRIDTVKHVNIQFWQQFARGIREYANANGRPDFFMYGEVYSGDVPYVSQFTTQGDLPAALDFPFQGTARGFASQSQPTNNLRNLFAADDYYTDANSNAYQLPTFLSNHDIGRFGLFLRQDNAGASDSELVARSTLAHALMYFGRGMPVVYYGDEQGFVGDGGDTGARQDMMPSKVPSYNDDDLIGTNATTAADNFDQSHPLYTGFQQLAQLRQAHKALRTGAQITRYSTDQAGIFAFSRIDRNEKIEYVVALNNAEQAKTATFKTYQPNTAFTAIAPANAAAVTTNTAAEITVTVPPLSYVVYKANSAISANSAAPTITITSPTQDKQVAGRLKVEAALNTELFAEVTFAVKVGDAANYTYIGTDNNAPYRVFYDTTSIQPGTPLSFKAIVNPVADDATGNVGAVQSATVNVSVGTGAPAGNPDSVTIAGSLQNKIGCTDWTPACEQAMLGFDNNDGVWQKSFALPAGNYEYKAALNGTWDENYGLNAKRDGPNIPLNLAAERTVKFYYDHKTHWITDNANSVIAIAPGDFQSELGCSGDWMPDCLRSWLQDPDGDGVYTFTTTELPAGSYQGKVAINESWDENYGANGEQNGPNIAFSVPTDGASVTFSYDSATRVLTIGGAPVSEQPAGPKSVTIAGSLQNELGCSGDWQPDCQATSLTFNAASKVWQGTYVVPAGNYEYKVTINGGWTENYGANGVRDGANIALNLAAQSTVTFTYDPVTHVVTHTVQ